MPADDEPSDPLRQNLDAYQAQLHILQRRLAYERALLHIGWAVLERRSVRDQVQLQVERAQLRYGQQQLATHWMILVFQRNLLALQIQISAERIR